VVDPENSVFYEYYQSGKRDVKTVDPSRIEGIGRPRVEPSFIPEVIDCMIKVPDAASIAAIHFLEGLIGRKCGGSTGTNVYGTLQLIHAMAHNGETGSLVTLINDSGDRYLDTYYNGAWLQDHSLHIHPYKEQLQHFYTTGEWQDLSMDDYETPAGWRAILV
jgi:cysteine synthase A